MPGSLALTHFVIPAYRPPLSPRHSRAGGNPVPRRVKHTHFVIPAKAGTRRPYQAPLTPFVIAHAARCMLAMTRVFNKQRLSEFFLLLFFFKCSKF